MIRPRIVINPTDPTSFTATHLQETFGRYFDIQQYSADCTYSRQDTLVMASKFDTSLWYRPLQQQGIQVVIENLWESDIDTTHPDCYVLRADNWFRYNEPLWYQALGYKNYVPQRDYKYTAFMPIRNQRPHRDQLIAALGPRLNTMLYSYVSQGRSLPNDLPNDLHVPGGDFQRYFNPDWYDSTHHSLVVETAVDSHQRLFVTEKSYKPLAFYHPFMVWGQRWTLWQLRKQGFQTFENLWDEEYDKIWDTDTRLTHLIKSLDSYEPAALDALTLEKLAHNHALFYNHDQIVCGIVGDVVNPLLELVSST